MAEVVYILCGMTSLACALLLFRAFQSNRTRLLFWSSLCFFGLALNNAFLFLDLIVFPDVPLYIVRVLCLLISLAALLYGLIWETA